MAFNSFMETKGKAGDGSSKGSNGGVRVSAFLYPKAGIEYTLRVRPLRYDANGELEFGHAFFRYWMKGIKKGERNGDQSLIARYPNPVSEKMKERGLSKGDKGYIGMERRGYMNVLNRTVVKIAPNGEVVYPTGFDQETGLPLFPETIDGENGKMSLKDIEAKPLNRIQVLEAGPSIIDQIGSYDRRVRFADRRPARPHEFDVTLLRIDGERTSYSVVPAPVAEELPDELRALPLYDIAEMGQPLPNDVIQRVVYEGADYYVEIEAILKEKGRTWRDFPMITAVDAPSQPDTEETGTSSTDMVNEGDEGKDDIPF